MKYEEALIQLAAGNPVYRESWEDEERYLDPQFAPSGADAAEFPFVAAEHEVPNGGRFRVDEYDATGKVGAYVFTEDDKTATDWIAG